MINLHVYPSPITNESRIEREVQTIESLGIFESVEVAGIAAPGLPDGEVLGEAGWVQRFASEAGSHGFMARAGKTVAFGRAVLDHYASKPLAVVNCHSVTALPTCVALKRATGAQLVYDTHELETEASASTGLRRPLYKALERLGIRQVNHTFTVTESIEKWYRRTYGLSEIDTIYNYPSVAQVGRPVDKNYFRRLFGVPDSVRLYLYQGVLGQGRGLETVVRAFSGALNRDSAVVFLGYGPLEWEVRSWAAEIENVFFHPAVRPRELASLTGAADVGLALTSGSQCLSYYYSAPNKMFQYWHAGVPVIASRLPEHERFLSQFSAGTLTDSESVDSFVEACRSLEQADPSELSSGLALAASELRWENYEDLFKSRYEFLANRAVRGSR